MIEPKAYLFLIGAPVLYALNAVLLKRGVSNIPPFTAMSISMTVLLMLSVVCATCFERPPNLTSPDNRGALMVLLLVGIVNTAAFWFFLNAYKYVTVWQYQLFGLLVPIFSAIFAYFIIGEPLSWRLFAGLGFMGLGLFVALM